MLRDSDPGIGKRTERSFSVRAIRAASRKPTRPRVDFGLASNAPDSTTELERLESKSARPRHGEFRPVALPITRMVAMPPVKGSIATQGLIAEDF